MHHNDTLPRRPAGRSPATCEACGRFFWALNAARKSGRGRYCSRSCANRARAPRGPRATLEAIFWRSVGTPAAPDICWEWQGRVDRKGYGLLSRPGTRRTAFAHRVSWELHYGAIPEGQCVLHHCDNPPCCNPAHLFLGTVADNNADMQRKGRGARGERAGAARLTTDQVRRIRWDWAFGATQTALAKRYGVHLVTVHLIVKGKNWRHLD